MTFRTYMASLLALPLCYPMLLQAQSDSLQKEKNNQAVEYGRHISVDLKESTTATAYITSDQLTHRQGINPRDVLYGLIPGLQVMQKQGASWETTGELSVRGRNTVNAATPLLIVDGFERDLDLLSVNEIESITVLKDAPSTALYGVRGANGVILVKTKRGSTGSPTINLSYEFNVAKAFRTPKFLNSYNYAQALNEARVNDGLSPRFDAEDLAIFQEKSYRTVYPDVDWWKHSLRDYGTGNNINFSVTGGGKYVKYYTQLSYLNDLGLLRPTEENDGYSTQLKYSRLNLRSNLDIAINRNTELQLNILGTFSEYNRPHSSLESIFSALYSVPSAAFPIKSLNGVWGGTTEISTNPVAMISGTGYDRVQQRDFYADTRITHKLDSWLPGLSIGAFIGLDNMATYWDTNARNYGYEQTAYDWGMQKYVYTPLRNETALAFSHSVDQSKNHYNIGAFAKYNQTWGLHTLSSTLQYSMDKILAKGKNVSYSFIDAVGQVHYAYAQRYIVDLALSGSAASVLRPGHRWGIFPAVGAAWLISQEKFIQAAWLNMLKLRASYGISGRADNGYGISIDMYGNGDSYLFGRTPTSATGIRMWQLGIADLTYEKSHKWNLGLDFQAFRKLSVTVDLFHDRRTDILVASAGKISSALGLDAPRKNAGIVTNQGIEALARWSDNIGNFKYSIGGNFAFTRNKIVEQNEEYRPYDYLNRTGHQIGQFYGYVVEGIYQNQEEIDQRGVVQTLSEVRPGDLRYKDLNGDKVIDSYDQTFIGYSTMPEIYYATDLNLEYRGFGFFAQFQGVANRSVLSSVPSVYRPLYGNRTISEEYYANRWTPETPNAIYPRLTSVGSDNNYANNSLWIKDGSFLKLRTLEVYYQFNAHQLRALKYVHGAKLYVRGYDLFSFDHIKVMDPENMTSGHPSVRRYAFGINLTF